MMQYSNSLIVDTERYDYGIWQNAALALMLAILWLSLAIAFNSWSIIDTSTTQLFFSVADCAGGGCGSFPAASVEALKSVRFVFHYLPVAVALGVIVFMMRDFALGLRWRHMRFRLSAIALITLVLGPGLLVNGFLKEFVGRPRPDDTLLFGGDNAFVAVGEWATTCQHNCSFVSGEASSIAWLICVLPLLPRKTRSHCIAPVLAIVFVTDMLRVAFGRHYLSDVVLGSLSTVTLYCCLVSACEFWMRRAVDNPLLPGKPILAS